MPVLMMQNGAYHLRPDMRLFLAQGVVTQNLVRVIAAQLLFQNFVFRHRFLQTLFREMQIIPAALLQRHGFAGIAAQLIGKIGPDRCGFL